MYYRKYATHIVIHSCDMYYRKYATHIVLAAACGRGAKQYTTAIVLVGSTGNTLRQSCWRRPAAALATAIVIHACYKFYRE